MDGIHQGQFVSQVRVSGVSTYGVATPRPLNASLPFRCTLKGTRDTLLKNHPYVVGETMQRRSEGTTWVRSTRGQLKSTRGSRRGHRSAPLSRLGRRGAHACTRIFPSSTPWAWVETTRVWDGCMGHLASLGERQARCTSAHTPPLGARIQTTRVWDGCMGHLAPLVERQARCTSAHTPPLGARDQTTRVWDRCMGHLAPLDERQAQRPCVCMST